MKKSFVPAAVALSVTMLVLFSCKKENTATPPNLLQAPSPTLTNSAPICYAGHDLVVFTPTNFCTLTGSAMDRENNITTILWSKIAGPSSFHFEHPDSLSTKLSNLQKGVYQFELTITDSKGMYGKDTIEITVMEISVSPNQILLENLEWIFPWYSALEVINFNYLIPNGIPFQVYIKRDTSPDWIEVFPISNNVVVGRLYEYFVETRPDGAGMYTFGSLYVFYYGSDVSDTPDIKLVY